MRPKSMMLLVLALGCGLVASIGISQVMDRQQGGDEVETTPIYVAAVDVGVGDKLTADMVRIESWPKKKVPAGAIRELDKIEGQRAKQALFADNPILDQMLGGGGIPAKTIPPGMRASSIKLGGGATAAELLNPGDHVDVQWTTEANKNHGITRPLTKIILTNVTIWAVDQAINQTVEGGEQRVARVVSLLVTMDQANRLDFAQKNGRIRLILRNPDDLTEDAGKSIGIEDLMEDDYQKAQQTLPAKKAPSLSPVAGPKAAWTTRIILGDEMHDVAFDGSGRLLHGAAGGTAPSTTPRPYQPPTETKNTNEPAATDAEGDEKESIDKFLSDAAR